MVRKNDLMEETESKEAQVQVVTQEQLTNLKLDTILEQTKTILEKLNK
jgi:hypothetical protein